MNRELIYDLDFLNSLFDSGRRQIAESIGVTAAQYSIFMLISDRQGETGVSVTTVAQLLHVSGPFITTQSKALVKKNLVEKVPNPDDGRSTLLRLTRFGDQAVEKLRPYLEALDEKVFGNFSRREFDALRHGVNFLIDNWDEAERVLPRPKRVR